MKEYKNKFCIICKKEFKPNSGAQKCCSFVCSEQKEKIYRTNYNKKYYINNKKEINAQNRKYYEEHKTKEKERLRKRYQANREKYKKMAIDYYASHKEQIKNNFSRSKEYRNQYMRNRRKNDINFKLATYLRNRIWDALQGNPKLSTTMKLVGCSIEKLKKHLEKQFKLGMSWDNYGYYGWHIDHIIPCAKFDLTKSSEQRKCFHYTNLQPLWAKENWNKKDK